MIHDRNFDLQYKIIAGICQSPDSQAVAFAKLNAEHFHAPGAREFFIRLQVMAESGQEVSVVTAAQVLPDGYNLSNLTAFMMVRPKEMAFLCDRLIDIAAGRKLRILLEKSLERLEAEATSDIAEGIMNQLFVDTAPRGAEQIVSGREQAVRAIDSISARMDPGRRAADVLYTNFGELNYACGGFERGDLIGISGQTGTGKSAFCQNLAADIGVRQRQPFLYINSEMSAEQMDFRWAAMLANHQEVTLQRIRAGQVDCGPDEKPTGRHDEFDAISAGLDRLYNSRFSSVTVPDLKIDSVVNIVRRHQRAEQIRACAIDYLGRADMVSGKRELAEWQLMTNAARRLKTLAQELKIVVFLVLQLNKNGDLQLAKAVENELDLHLSIQPMDENEIRAELARLSTCNYKLNILKGRNAPRGWIPLRFDGPKLRFEGRTK